MNEADPSSINLDELRMLPDWLRENAPPPSKQYAGHDYPFGDEGSNRRGDRRSGGFDARGGNSSRDRRGPGGPPDRRREGGRPGGPPPRGGSNRGPRDDQRPAPMPMQAPALPAPVRVEFLPDSLCLASINKQIRTTHLAYPLFGLARMFLQEPARHVVQFTLMADAPEGSTLHQLGDDGIVTLDRSILEKQAFESTKDQFYVDETVQKEPLKGNFTNVARERLSGTLLGPTNYHAYQPALRALYETRYSRRMSFDEFRRNIEVSTDPALVEKWKEEARTTTTTSTRVAEGETPVVLSSAADARTHFRQHHLDALVRSGTSFRVHGSIARKLPEHGMMQAIREAHDREMRYPAQFVQLLRQGLQNAGLHIFKHRKRVVYVSLARPTPFVAQGTVSTGLSAILETIAQFPLCTRKVLAEHVLARNASPVAPIEIAQPVVIDSAVPTVAPETNAAATTPEPEKSASEFSEQLSEKVVSAGSEQISSSDEATPMASVVPVEITPTPESAPVSTPVAVEDPVAKAKGALAADLRFLVQAGHIIEFHNGTFDLPLPPREKEEGGGQAPNQNKSLKGKLPSKSPQTAIRSGPATVPVSSEPVPKTVFVASGVGVEETIADVEKADAEAVPSLDESIEPAPTAAGLDEGTTGLGLGDLRSEDIVITAAPMMETDNGLQTNDKTDHDGLISGAGAAPIDLPIPGDTDDSPAAGL